MNPQSLVVNEKIENAVMRVCEELEHDRRKKTWVDFSEKELWLELISCILGSRVRSETATACSNHLRERNLVDISIILKKPRETETKISIELAKSIFPPHGCKYPFPRSKATCIVVTAVEIYEKDNTSIKQILSSYPNPLEARKVLVSKCRGIGFKQASLFLRNVSFCDNLAILDTHVVRFIESVILRTQIRLTKNQYLFLERILYEYAQSKRVSLATLDFSIWIVMRLIQREFANGNRQSRIWGN